MLKHIQLLKRLIVCGTYALWVLVLFSIVKPTLPWSELGELMGEAAIGMLVIVTLPGILKRFEVTGVYKQIQLLLMSVRRQTGDLMFTFAVAHAVWVRILLYIRFGLPDPASIPLFQIFGTLTLLLLFPLFLTSNNFSVRLLKKNWQRIHYLVYIAVWFAALHTLLGIEGQIWGILAVGIGVAQIASWMNVYKKHRT
ncbi:MAG: ferric reductase-like transmembrane domain-containing protein [Candidatus Roizmanbacteria bacterium]|nr:ferric reductase-like transmembrane domain-containing protein [Candidatus Roizmanbacteria bacterium]